MNTASSKDHSLLFFLAFFISFSTFFKLPSWGAEASPPASPVKLIFIHHSVGENWLADDNGGLGIALMNNNYFVSDTNYGWGPDSIGDRTDIGYWYEWFNGPSSSTYLTALYGESGQNSSYSRLGDDPGGENTVIMFKSCFPNSNLGGNPANPPTSANNPLRGEDAWSTHMTIENAKGIYMDLLNYFATRQDKLFVAITAPPLASSATTPAHAANARAFNDWLVHKWLANYHYRNVAVFDFYNVLTSNGGSPAKNDAGQEGGNHHRWRNGAVQHVHPVASHTSAYPTEDSHPSRAGNLKATQEFVPVLNYFYNRWKEFSACRSAPAPDIKVNGSDSDISIREGEELVITASLDPGCDALRAGDWWVAASTPQGLTFFDVIGQTLSWRSGLSVTYQGPLVNLPSVHLPNPASLPPGFYTFYFGVDLNKNGRLDPDSLFYDGVGVEIRPSSTPASRTQLLQPGDFQYLGAFRLPGGEDPPRTFAYGGNAMTFRPDGDPGGAADGFPGSLFITGHERTWDYHDGDQIAEVTIPAPVISRNVADLNSASFVQEFHDILSKIFPGLNEIPRVGMEFLDHPATGPKIHVAFGQHFQDDSSTMIPSHAWIAPDLSAPDPRGAWYIGNQSLYSVNGYLFEIPANWADAHTGGKYLATGRYRDGGWSGQGPSLFAYRPWVDEAGTPAPDGAHLSETPLLLYESSLETDDVVSRSLHGYQHPDEWEGGAWITTTSGKEAVLFAGTKGTGAKYWYGWMNPAGPDYPCIETHGDPMCRLADGSQCPPEDLQGCTGHNDVRGWWSSRFDAQFILYDPSDLGKVAAGEMESWQPQPYAVLDIDEHLYLNPPAWDEEWVGKGPQRRFRIGAVAYDRDHNLLYVLELFADSAKPVVHVWRVL